MAFRLSFGKHIGKTLEWIFFHDPGYIKWILKKDMRRNILKFSTEERSRFEDLVRRASHLRIPRVCPLCGKRTITKMSLRRHISGGLGKVKFHCDECMPRDISDTPLLNASLLESDYFRSYDKTGAWILIRKIKWAYFGDPSIRLSQRRLEEFFDNPNNFVNF